jgi:hypothetical protein
MSLDGRIRTGLNADASELEPATDPALDVILERGPRRRTARTVLRSVGIAAVVAVFLAGGFALRALRGGGGVPANGALNQVSPIDGQWQMTLTVQEGLDAGLDYGRARQQAGPRKLELALGVVRLIRPGSFETVPVNGTFRVDGSIVVVHDRRQTLVFRWELAGKGVAANAKNLRLTLVDDSRSVKGDDIDRYIWTTQIWHRIG